MNKLNRENRKISHAKRVLNNLSRYAVLREAEHEWLLLKCELHRGTARRGREDWLYRGDT